MSGPFAEVQGALGALDGVSEGRMFGSAGLKFAGKVFAMEVKGRLVVKPPAARVDALVAAGAQRFDPGHGRLMREWASVAAGPGWDWLALAREALEGARGR